MANNKLKQDRQRYKEGGMPLFQYFFRKMQSAWPVFRWVYMILFKICSENDHVLISPYVNIGGGLYIEDAYGISIREYCVLGENVNIYKGVTIAQENRGKRLGYPTIGSNVWLGVNAVVVGKVHIGDDVLIAANSFVNCDVPPHSVVFGNPCIIKHKENATEGYINNKI